jgi:hypothetical protein
MRVHFFFGAFFSIVFRCMSLFSLSSGEGLTSVSPPFTPTIVRCRPVAAEVRTTENPAERDGVYGRGKCEILRTGVEFGIGSMEWLL